VTENGVGMARATDPLRLVVIGALTLAVGIRALYWLRDDTGSTSERPKGAAAVSGQVVDDTGKPVGAAQVAITNEAESIRLRLEADDRGRFSAADLPAGVYWVNGSKEGYLGGRGNRFTYRAGLLPEGTTIQLADGQHLGGMTVIMTRGSVLSGVVYDEHGQPAPRRYVRALRREPRFDDVAYTDVAPLASTDDRGRYRITGLPADTYYLMASLGQGMAARVYYPSASKMGDAAPVIIEIAEERTGLDLRARPVPTSTIGGTVKRADATPAAGIRVDLVAAIGTEPDARQLVTTAGPDGAFLFNDIPPDHYFLIAHGAPGPGAPVHVWGRALVTSDGTHPLHVPLIVVPGTTISGQVKVDALDGTKPPQLDRSFLFLVGGDAESDAWLNAGERPMPEIDERGGLVLRGVPPGQYVLTETFLESPWRIESVMTGTRDLLDSLFEVTPQKDISGLLVTLVDRSAQIEGIARDDRGLPLINRLVIAFPPDSRLWQRAPRRRNMGRTDASGHFKIDGLPPGDYLLADASASELGQFNEWWGTPAFYKRLTSQAIQVSLSRGERRVQDLTVR